MTRKSAVREVTEKVAREDARVDRIVSPHRKEPLVRAAAFASEIGDQPQMRLLSGAVFAIGLLTGNGRLARAGVRMLVAHEAATFAKDLVKKNVVRTRPRSARRMDQREPRPGQNRDKEESSFPSGHTAGAISVARAFSREYPEHRAAALTAASLVAAAQVPRCAHYVSDVGVGAAIGLASEAAVHGVFSAAGQVRARD